MPYSAYRKMNFAQNFDNGHKKGLLYLAFSSIVLYCVCSGMYGKICKFLQFSPIVRQNLFYFQYGAYILLPM